MSAFSPKPNQPNPHVVAASDSPKSDRQSALDLVRQKIATIYGQEKTMSSELNSMAAQPTAQAPESKHQKYMRELSTSGQSLADIQVAWHNYYQGLPDHEKHEVWREFYSANERPQPTATSPQPASVQPQPAVNQSPIVAHTVLPDAPRVIDRRRPMAIRKRILSNVAEQVQKPPKLKKTKRRQKFESLFFGLGIGLVAMVIFLFGFFNEYIISPFMQPSRTASATPVILNTDGVAPSAEPEVIIPKIGVQIPVDYTLTTVAEDAVQASLDNGVVHYANTVKPGEVGNTAIFGHSSNNIFNKGKYKFAFVSLHKLQDGDTFYLTNNGKIYAYRVFKKQVVLPHETWVLNAVEGKKATATLITCDPPGSTSHRLVVWGEQISPDPEGATAPTNPQPVNSDVAPAELAGKGPSAWSRFWGWVNPFN